MWIALEHYKPMVVVGGNDDRTPCHRAFAPAGLSFLKVRVPGVEWETGHSLLEGARLESQFLGLDQICLNLY